MELKQLEYFRTIVEEGSVSAAARKLHLSQPPLSYQMKMLEEELGVTLYTRGPRHITLTNAGKALYARSASILTLSDITKREVSRTGRATMLHIGMTPSTVSLMSSALMSAMARFPDLHFDIHDGSTFVLRDLLCDGVLDAAVLRTPVSLQGLSSLLLQKESLTAVAHRDLLRGRERITLRELQDQRLILSERYRSLCIAAFDRAGLTCDIFYECQDARTALSLADAGLGFALLPPSLKSPHKETASAEIADAVLETNILIAWRPEDMSPVLSSFLDIFR